MFQFLTSPIFFNRNMPLLTFETTTKNSKAHNLYYITIPKLKIFVKQISTIYYIKYFINI